MKNIAKRLSFAASLLLFAGCLQAQEKSLTNTLHSPFARLHSVNMGSVHWTTGFWAERFQVCRDSMVPNMWRIYNDDNISHAFKNFKIAAGLDTGQHVGPSFHDGDYYKTLEAVAALYANTKDPHLDAMMDAAIAVIGKSQRADGYIYTKSVIDQRKTGEKKEFESRLSFEAYNIGHLMTAACVHYRATGKTNLLSIARKAGDYLIRFYQTATPETARNAICPSHYMGLLELYRTTGEEKYKLLAKKLVDIRGEAAGSDDNSDRYPFREMKEVQGHAVRANYLFAGAADLFAETGDSTLLQTLNRMWDDVVHYKMYITGGCGALYDGVSNDGTSYNPADVEKLHQAYGRKYQLPNLTAHNETCANIGNLLWNWRMLQLTGQAAYADVLELALYNSVLSGISLDGKKFLYTNPLAYSGALPFQQRWSKERVPYIALSNCCPPNVVRTVAEVSNYMYSLSDKGLYVNLYGGNTLSTTAKNGAAIRIEQQTAYPWEGTVRLVVAQVPADFSFFLRIPGWAEGASIYVNERLMNSKAAAGSYAQVKHSWKKGDVIRLVLPLKAKLMEANPLVEEARNQVAVKRGPLVYCLEAADLPDGADVFSLGLPAGSHFTPEHLKVDGADLLALRTTALQLEKEDWQGGLYKELPPAPAKKIAVRLVPYFAWGNRGLGNMTVWLPVR